MSLPRALNNDKTMRNQGAEGEDVYSQQMATKHALPFVIWRAGETASDQLQTQRGEIKEDEA